MSAEFVMSVGGSFALSVVRMLWSRRAQLAMSKNKLECSANADDTSFDFFCSLSFLRAGGKAALNGGKTVKSSVGGEDKEFAAQPRKMPLNLHDLCC